MYAEFVVSQRLVIFALSHYFSGETSSHWYVCRCLDFSSMMGKLRAKINTRRDHQKRIKRKERRRCDDVCKRWREETLCDDSAYTELLERLTKLEKQCRTLAKRSEYPHYSTFEKSLNRRRGVFETLDESEDDVTLVPGPTKNENRANSQERGADSGSSSVQQNSSGDRLDNAGSFLEEHASDEEEVDHAFENGSPTLTTIICHLLQVREMMSRKTTWMNLISRLEAISDSAHQEWLRGIM